MISITFRVVFRGRRPGVGKEHREDFQSSAPLSGTGGGYQVACGIVIFKRIYICCIATIFVSTHHYLMNKLLKMRLRLAWTACYYSYGKGDTHTQTHTHTPLCWRFHGCQVLVSSHNTALAGVTHLAGCHPVTREVASLIAGQGTCPGCRFSPWLAPVHRRRVVNASLWHQRFLPSLLPFPSL